MHFFRQQSPIWGKVLSFFPGTFAGQAGELVLYQPVHLTGKAPAIELPDSPEPVERLEWLEAHRLTCPHESSGRGITEVSFRIGRGIITVVTGRFGSGKTTLVRALLGLLPLDTNEEKRALWAGEVV